MPKIVVGLGTGRCGTTSLAGLLNQQPGAHVTHQRHRVHWRGNLSLALACAFEWHAMEATICGDVNFSWLPYVWHLAGRFPAIQFVCMERDREGYVESWVASQNRNAWLEDWDAWYDLAYMQLGIPQVDVAAGLYWDIYHRISSHLQSILPDRFRIFPTNTLNTEDGQREILRFAGVEEPVLEPGLHLNRRGTEWSDRFERST